MAEKVPGSPSRGSHERFDPKAYLRQNYSRLDYDSNDAFLKFLVDAYRDLGTNEVLLEFGGGPALCSPLAASRAREIHFCDYLEVNLEEVCAWLGREGDAFDWGPFTRRILEIESGGSVDEQAVLARAEVLRSKLKVVGRCDATATAPLESSPDGLYDAVSAQFVINAAARSREHLPECLANIGSLLRPGGLLILTSSYSRSRYNVGRQVFPLASIAPDDLIIALDHLGFPAAGRQMQLVPSTAYGESDGYLFIRARKAEPRDDGCGAAERS